MAVTRQCTSDVHEDKSFPFSTLRDHFAACAASITSGAGSVPSFCVLWSITPIRKSYLPGDFLLKLQPIPQHIFIFGLGH